MTTKNEKGKGSSKENEENKDKESSAETRVSDMAWAAQWVVEHASLRSQVSSHGRSIADNNRSIAELREIVRDLSSSNSPRIRYVFPVAGGTQSIDVATVLKELDIAISALEHSDDIEAASALMSVRLRLVEVRKQMLTTQNRMGYVAGLIYDALTFTDHPQMTHQMVLGLRRLMPTLTESPFSPSILMDVRRRLLELGFNVVPTVNA